MMKIKIESIISKLAITISMVLSCQIVQAAYNPLASYYSTQTGYPSWTNRLKWDNVIDMSSYSNGTTTFEKFENARDLLYAQGGGVLYYPAGNYAFTLPNADSANGRGLMLKKGVVILGQEPTNDKTGIDGTLGLSTVFQFSFQTVDTKVGGVASTGQRPYVWNIIGLTTGNSSEQLKEVNDVGICLVKVDGATLYFGPQLEWGATYATAGSFLSGSVVSTGWKNRTPTGEHYFDTFCGSKTSAANYIGSGSGRLVFGCEFSNCAQDLGNVIDPSKGEWKKNAPNYGYHTYKYGARVGVYGSEVFIANNILSKPTKSFKADMYVNFRKKATPYDDAAIYPRKTIATTLYDYAKTCGIDVNKQQIGVVSATARKSLSTSPYYHKNILIIDNYVYNHGNKGMELSGEWITVKGNKNIRDFLASGDNVYNLSGVPYILTLDGYLASYEIDDNVARAIDLGGKNLWADRNYFNNTGSNPGNDGEGLLCQRHNDIEIFSWALTNNEKGLDGDASYIGGWDVHNFGHLVFKNKIPTGWVGHAKASANVSYATAFVNNESFSLLKDFGNLLDPVITICAKIGINPPTDVVLVKIENGLKITWNDNAQNEIGFRIDRRVKNSNTWSTIAYRPLQSTTLVPANLDGYIGLDQNINAPAWNDYLLSPNTEYDYRVIALDCDENLNGASNIVSYVPVVTSLYSIENSEFESNFFPNPFTSSTKIFLPQGKNIVSVYNLSGQLISKIETTSTDFSFGEELKAGVYMVKVNEQSIKVIKQ